MTSDLLEHKQLRNIVVDLTPVLPGGDNGGAKVFVLELLRRLGELAPQTQFMLLTQASAHEELAALDSTNIRRMMVLDHGKTQLMRTLTTKIFTRVLRHLPGRLRFMAGRIGHRFMMALRKSGTATLLHDLKADLLFCPFTAPIYFELTVPTVCVIYDLQYKTYPEFFTPEDVANRDRSFMEAARRATALVAISDYSRNAAIAAAHLDPNLIRTIHLHVSQHSLRNARRDETIFPRLRLTKQKYLIYPANFWKHKNHEMLLTAFGIARQTGLADDISLVCTGAPGERQQFMQQAASAMGLGERVLFPGYVSHAELLALMANCAGIVFPSLYEGYGLPVIEAMALGVPVACSNVTSLPEVAGDAAILFNPRRPDEVAAAMVSLVEDGPRRTHLIEAGNARAASFSDSRLLARQYWEVFEQAVGAEKQSNILLGVTPDGWVGQGLRLQISAASQPQSLDLEVVVPQWVPIPKLTLQWTLNGEISGSKVIIRGEPDTVSIPLPAKGGYFEVEFSPTFVPAFTGHGDDQRELSATLKSCVVKGGNAPIVLFPEQMPS